MLRVLKLLGALTSYQSFLEKGSALHTKTVCCYRSLASLRSHHNCKVLVKSLTPSSCHLSCPLRSACSYRRPCWAIDQALNVQRESSASLQVTLTHRRRLPPPTFGDLPCVSFVYTATGRCNRCVNVCTIPVRFAARPVRRQGRAACTEMPVISVGRDKLFKALGREYSKLLLLCVASAISAPHKIWNLARWYSMHSEDAVDIASAYI